MKKIKFSKINKIIEDAKKGKIFVLVDDEGRENEGDLIIPASKVSAKSIKFCVESGFLLKITSSTSLSMSLGISS